MRMRWASFNRLEFQLPQDAVDECSASGSVDEAVEYWTGKVDLSRVDADKLREELREYGAWDDDELADDAANRRRIVWIGACNVSEDHESQD